MLVLRHNTLSSDNLITCERTMLKFIDGKLSNTGMNLKVWDWTIPELYGIVLGMLVKLDLRGTLDITSSDMLDFIIEVDNGYLDTSYHSFYHAVDVVAVLYYMLTDLGAGKYLTSLDCISLLLAGLCHDIGHAGLNNVYQVNARTELAIKYNDQSVLENHSCALTMNILTKHKLLRNVHKCNTEYLGMDPKEAEQSLRDLITKTILATDMIFHFDLMENLNNMIESIWSPCSSENSGDETDQSCPASPVSSVPSSLESSSPISLASKSPRSLFSNQTLRSSPRGSMIVSLDAEQRKLWLKVLIHAADLSNTVRPWEISKRWSDLVVEEFFLQGDLEKKNKLPVSPNMDRTQAHQCQISLGFGDFVVKPYFEAFAAFLQSATIFLDILADNRVYWNDLNNAPPTPPLETPSINALSPDKNSSRRVSLAAGLLIIPDDIQEKLRSMTSPRSPRYRKLKRSLSGRSYSHHSLLPPTHGVLAADDDDDLVDDSYRKPTRRKSAGPNPSLSGQVSAMLEQPPPSSFITIQKTLVSKPSPMSTLSTPMIITIHNPPTNNSSSKKSSNSNSSNSGDNKFQRCFGRVRRSSSLDHNMIRQITAIYGSGNNPNSPQTEQRALVAGS